MRHRNRICTPAEPNISPRNKTHQIRKKDDYWSLTRGENCDSTLSAKSTQAKSETAQIRVQYDAL